MRPNLTVLSHTKLFPCLLTPKLTTVYTPSYSLVSLPSELTTRSCYLGLHIATLVLKDPRSKEQSRYNLEAVGLRGIEIHSAGQKCPDPWLRASPGPNPTLDNSYVGIPLPTQFIRVGFKPQTSHRRDGNQTLDDLAHQCSINRVIQDLFHAQGCNAVDWIELAKTGIGIGSSEVDWIEISQDRDKLGCSEVYWIGLAQDWDIVHGDQTLRLFIFGTNATTRHTKPCISWSSAAIALEYERCVLPSKNLTAKCMSTNKNDPDPDMVPLKFTTSKAATWKAVETRGGEEDDWPWFQSYMQQTEVLEDVGRQH
ncbi:unnamed protein product [Timema podura]|uniref:Uncharacterized protein n=1 Tax=Timema podura TaxID=61482 RepID=A0ABN7NFY0_TIMPD|nr:unnamed protein product [Timema podura]